MKPRDKAIAEPEMISTAEASRVYDRLQKEDRKSRDEEWKKFLFKKGWVLDTDERKELDLE